MKKIGLVLSTLVLILSSCATGNNGTGACGSGMNLCFELDGNTVSVNASWYDINPNRHRIYWEETSGSNYKNIEIDLYGSLSASTYTITSSASANGEASFQYYLSGSTSANYQGASGSVIITNTGDNKITGTFSGTVTNASVTYNITNGKIDAVPHQ